MKKFSLQLLTAFVTGNNDRIKASKIFFLAFLFCCIGNIASAQISIGTATGGRSLCGPAPACTAIGNITITETVPGAFAAASGSLSLIPPAGWEFCGTAPTYSITVVGDLLTASGAGFASTGLTFQFTSGGTTQLDQITISGLSVRPLTPSSLPGDITASAVSGINGIALGVDSFGHLALFPGVIEGNLSICAGACTQLSVPVAGGVWTSSNPAVATIDPVTGYSCSPSLTNPTATTTITNTNGGCSATTVLTVNQNPSAIAGVHDICQNVCYTVSDNPTNGIFTGTLVTLVNTTPIGNSGTATLCGVPAGVGTVTYTLPSGCFVTASLNVNPLPQPIIDPLGTYEICAGSSRILTNGTPSGTWSSQSVSVATIVAATGEIFGVAPGGITRITYTLPGTGCAVDTPFRVYPVPSAIVGSNSVCVGSSITLSSATPLGVWISSATGIAAVSSTGVVTGVSPGVATITYQLTPGSCFVTFDVTVNPIPDPITGPSSVCLNSQINLSSATPGGVWSSQQPFFASADPATGTVCGLQVSTVIIYYTLPTSCFQTHIVDIFPLDTIAGPSHVCQFDSITLTNVTPGGGTWSSSNVTVATIDPVTGVLVGVNVGTTTVGFTTPTGCADSFVVTVDSAAGPISGPDSVCQGSTITLSVSTTGGTWSSVNPVIAAVDPNTGVVTGVTATYVTVITYTMRSGCVSAHTVTVNSLPGTITGPSSVCKGFSITLVDTPAGVGIWISSDTNIAKIDSFSGVLTGKDSGVVTINYLLPSGCISAPFTVRVHPLDSTTGPTVVCAGDTIRLVNNTFTTGVGVWSSLNPFVATVDPTGLVWGVQPGGVATIRYVLPTGCFALYTVTVNPMPNIAGPNNVCRGDSISLTVTLPGGTAAGTWSSANPAIATVGTTGIVGVVMAGVTNIIFTQAGSGCSRSYSVTVNPHEDIIVNLPADVCVGSFITLSNPVAGGTWSTSNTAVATVTLNTGDVYGVSQGGVTVSYTTGAGCISTATVNVNRQPDTIRGAMPICSGSSIQLSNADMPNGTWSTTPPSVGTIDPISVLFTGLGASGGLATVTFTLSSTGCFRTDTIRVYPVVSPILGLADVCIYDTVILSNLDTTGIWSTLDTAIVSIDTIGHTLQVIGDSTGTAVIIYTLPSTGCITTFTVTVHALPVLNISATDTLICRGGSNTLSVTSTESMLSYIWNPAVSCVSPICDIATVNPQFSTEYVVTGTSIYGCVGYDTIMVWVDSALNNLKITGDSDICVGECTLLHATGGVDTVYRWSPFTGLSCTNCQNTYACPANTTVYAVTAIDFVGCSRTVTYTVTVNALPVLVINPSPVIVCKRSTTTVTVSGAGVGGHYTWTPNVFINCDTCATVILSDTANIIYEVTGTSIHGCTDSISVLVSVLDTNVNTISNDTIICINDTITLRAYSQSLTGNLDIPTFIWTPSAGLSAPNTNVTQAYPTSTTIYTVVITENVCFKDTLHVQVTVEPLPGIVTVPESATVVHGSSVQLLASAPNVIVSGFAWAPANTLSCDTCPNPIATPVTGTTVYTVTAVSSFGCISYDTISIHTFCDNSQIFIPNTFTPNGDGVNDRFYISGKGISNLSLFAVYNRWGQLLYEVRNFSTNDPSVGWDGTYKGYVLPPDVFYYQVIGQCELGGEPFTYSGDVSIVR